jgi:hypothetical protein
VIKYLSHIWNLEPGSWNPPINTGVIHADNKNREAD